MNCLVVSAHHDQKSLTAELFAATLGVLQRDSSIQLAISDLFAQHFNPVASSLDFKTLASQRDYIFQQSRAAKSEDGFSPDIAEEIAKLRQADLVIIHFPLWWSSVPALMKGWLDRVLAMGVAWGPEARYQDGFLAGKAVFCVVSVGDPQSFYSADGQHGATVEQHLYGLLHSTFALCGLEVYAPEIIYDTTVNSDDLSEEIKNYQNNVLPNVLNGSAEKLF